MASGATRTLRSAVAGAVAAGVWAVQQPLDRRAFGVAYDDATLLGSAVTREPAGARTRVVGTGMHLANGAVFGALYSWLPGSGGALKGLAAGLAEHLLTWPATALVPRVHPIGDTFPRLWGDHRAFGQAVWRHALFGVVLGALEARLNPPTDPPSADGPGLSGPELNGHAPVDRLIVTGPA